MGRRRWADDVKRPPSTVHYSEWPWEQLAGLILSPGVPLTHPKPHTVVELAKMHHVPIIGEVEALCAAQPEATYIGITGTNGKSTTTALIGHILQQCGKNVQVGGNLGTPALALEPLGEGGIYVLELSSYQLDLMHEARMNIAVLLNITPDHLDRHGDMQGYIAAKKRIFRNQQKHDTAVIAVDDAFTGLIAMDLGEESEAEVMRVSAAQVEGNISPDETTLLPLPVAVAKELAQMPALKGRHNYQNAIAAYAACLATGIAPEKILHAMRSFPGLAHRMEKVGESHGISFINDSKATNAEAAANALLAFENIYWIAGGKPKEGGIESLKLLFPRIRHAFLIGEAAQAFAQTIGSAVPVTISGTLSQAVQDAWRLARIEGYRYPVILLSPACASFDQFTSFEERGDRFRTLAKSLMEQTT